MRQDVRGAGGWPNVFYKPFAKQTNECRRLKEARSLGAQKEAIGDLACSAAGAPHSLHKARNCAGTIDLNHAVEIAYVDSELHRRCRNDDAVLPLGKHALRERTLVRRKRSVDEKG